MLDLIRLQSELTSDGKITPDDVVVIRHHIEQDGILDYEDVKFLVNLLVSAKQVCPEFDALFFPILRTVLLDDGRIGIDEQYQLLRMLYGDGRVRDCEKQFLRDLRVEAEDVSPEFQHLCETAFASPETGWSVGGRTK